MSNRTLVELNHDYCPKDDLVDLELWAMKLCVYMRSADKRVLPVGVIFKHMRHHSESCPLDELARLTKENKELRFVCAKAKTFIEYARYELDPGKAVIGDQFPKQEDADVEISRLSEALKWRDAAPPLTPKDSHDAPTTKRAD